MPTNKKAHLETAGKIISGVSRKGMPMCLALPPGATVAQVAKGQRITLASKGAELLWAAVFEDKKLSRDDLEWLLDTFRWLEWNPTGCGDRPLIELMDLVETFPGDK